MEVELREAFRAVHDKLDEIRREQTRCQVHCATQIATLDASAKSAHKRITDVERRAGGRVALWIGVLGAFVTAISAAIAAWIGGRR